MPGSVQVSLYMISFKFPKTQGGKWQHFHLWRRELTQPFHVMRPKLTSQSGADKNSISFLSDQLLCLRPTVAIPLSRNMPPRILFHRDIFLDCSFPPSGPHICCSFSHCLHIRQVPIWQVSSKSFLTPTPRLHLISVPYSYRTCTVFAICLGLPCGVYVWMNAQVPKQVNKGSIFKNLRMDDSYRPGASAHVGKDLAHQGVLREVFFSNPGPGVTAASDQGFFIHRACHTGVGVFTYSLSSGCAISAFWLCPYCSTSD